MLNACVAPHLTLPVVNEKGKCVSIIHTELWWWNPRDPRPWMRLAPPPPPPTNEKQKREATHTHTHTRQTDGEMQTSSSHHNARIDSASTKGREGAKPIPSGLDLGNGVVHVLSDQAAANLLDQVLVDEAGKDRQGHTSRGGLDDHLDLLKARAGTASAHACLLHKATPSPLPTLVSPIFLPRPSCRPRSGRSPPPGGGSQGGRCVPPRSP
jgi:hypothetical protein